MKNTSTSANAHTIPSNLKTKIKSPQFLQTNYDILESKELNGYEKLFISYIIGWQYENKICYETNASLAKRFGLSIGGIRKIISKLNKYDFFKSTQYGEKQEKGNFTSTHTIIVDVDKLIIFLQQDKLSSDLDIDDSTEDIQQPIQSTINEPDVFKTSEIASVDIDDKDRHEDRLGVYDEELDIKIDNKQTDELELMLAEAERERSMNKNEEDDESIEDEIDALETSENASQLNLTAWIEVIKQDDLLISVCEYKLYELQELDEDKKKYLNQLWESFSTNTKYQQAYKYRLMVAA